MTACAETALVWELLHEPSVTNDGNVVELQNLYSLFLEILPERRRKLSMAGLLASSARVRAELEFDHRAMYSEQDMACAFGSC